MYVLDTNTLIHFFKGMGRVSDRMVHVPPEEIGIPAVVVYELEVGLANAPAGQRRREQLAGLFEQARVLPFGRAQARAAAELRTKLDQLGLSIGPPGTLIAGTALAASATLVTHDTRAFERVPDLTVEDWY
ncbi:MAG: type II toxin-antitoxin system VapC family toxin [Trueperaceae bacterium]|nr:type II toxin-antitoxin system VapC family toxin [Trueperaceae bacterium]